MKKLFFLIAYWVLPFSASTQTVYSLKQCIDFAWANNLQVKQSALQLERAETQYFQAKNNKLPTVSGNFNMGLNNGRSIDPFTNGYITQQLLSSNTGINASYIVYDGQRLKKITQQNGLLVQAAKMDVQQEKDNLTLNVILTYLQVLSNEDLLTLAQSQAEVTKKQIERLSILDKAGAIQPALLYDMKGQLASDELGIVNAENSLASAKLTLAQWMNVPFDKSIRLEKIDFDSNILPLDETPVADIYADALKQLSVIKAAEWRKESAKLGTRIAKASFSPRVSLFGQLGTNYSSAARRALAIGTSDVTTNNYVEVSGNRIPVFTTETNFKSDRIGYFSQFGNNLNSFIGVNVQIPIFDAFQTRSLVQLAQTQEKVATNDSDIIQRQLRQAVEQAALNKTAAYNKFTVLTSQVQAFQQSFNVAEKRFTEGVIHSVDYLIVKNNLDRANANWVNARYEYILRLKVLDFYRGKN